MPVKIVSDELGRSFKLGRRRPVALPPRLHLKNYLMRSMPAAPAAFSYTPLATECLAQVLGNDDLGDCTAAAAFHVAGVMRANAGEPTVWDTEKEVIPFYSATSGYVVGNDKTDNGANITDVLNYWQHNGLRADGTHKILSYVAVSAHDAEEIAAAIWLFEHLYCGVSLPDAWVDPIPQKSGFIWDVAGPTNPDNGHAFPGFAYDKQGMMISTWGMLGVVTWAALAQYGSHTDHGELYVAVSLDLLIRASQKAPNGFDMEHLLGDIRFFSGA